MNNVLMIAAVSATLALSTQAHADSWKDQYKTVRFGVLSGENEKDRIARWTPFENYLEKELGVEVQIFTAGNYDGVIQALAADQIEFAFLGSSAYAAAYTETNGGVEPLLASQENDGSTGYYSVIAVRCDSGYKSVDDLKGKVLAFADPDSTSGYAVPFFNLVKQGYDPKSFFSAIPFSGAHETGVMGVANKQFDAAATYINNETSGIPQRMESKGMIPKGEICRIWQSPEITNGPFTARTNLPEDLIRDMKAAVKAVPEKAPDVHKEMTGGENSTSKGYVDVDAQRYQWIIEMREWLRKQRRAG
ncbi:phosphonate ABC transporter substrate-binding protein [Rhizobium sp. BK251]|uniref:phosphonate ABC transporter substrate-binding protein n=1 Tax=Rhizobium sp. BK251 TaxID=2512125 RepID=UPI0010D1FBBD|nr:phosphonate ABC transporter substrate-binding protein [Rhizobium sp. BK251]TCL67235.1 phosphonate transport system substrate-binding protein [Rhizobium sp. BK251]